MSNLLQDLRYALRMLKKNPGFTTVAVLTLALGIGANTAAFSIVDAVMFRPLPVVRAPQELAYVSSSWSYPLFESVRKENSVFDGMFALGGGHAVGLTISDQPEIAHAELVSADYFSVLGIRPAVGRVFLSEEDRAPGTHPVIVLSHRFWKSRFGGDPGVVDKKIRVNGRPYTIVGVAAAGFVGTEVGLVRDMWIPLTMQAQIAPAGFDGNPDMLARADFFWMAVVGRVKSGVSLKQAESQVASLYQQHVPEEDRLGPYKKAIQLLPVTGSMDPRERGDFLPAAGLLFAVVGMVLLIACVNLANLLLARASSRYKEIGIRFALGASRARVIRQLLAESVLLSLAGGVCGFLFSLWLSDISALFAPVFGQPFDLGIHTDARVLAATLVISLMTGILFGILPALRVSRREVTSALKGGSEMRLGERRSRLRSTLVVAQLSLSLVMLISAGLFVRSLSRATSLDLGFRTDNSLMLSVNLDQVGLSEAQGRNFLPQLMETLETAPGVTSASAVRFSPLGLESGGTSMRIEGRPESSTKNREYFPFNLAGPRYFETMGIPILRGRDFTARDNAAGPPVVIINDAAAQRFWPGEDPLGRRVSLHQGVWSEVVGVVRNSVLRDLSEKASPTFYQPVLQEYAASFHLVVRTTGDPLPLIPIIRESLHRLNGDLMVNQIRTTSDQISNSLLPRRIGAMVLAAAGCVALSLAVIGIYGVLSFAIALRTREIGVRMALGAAPRDVLRLVIGEGMRMSSWGIGLGIVLSLAVTRLLAGFLFAVSPTDAFTFVGVSALLAGAALLACYLPARRASRVDPMVALRYE